MQSQFARQLRAKKAQKGFDFSRELGLALNPEYSEVYHSLAHIYKVQGFPEKSVENLHKAFEDTGQCEKSFTYLLAGNKLIMKGYKYSIQAEQHRFQALKDIFKAPFNTQKLTPPAPDNTPMILRNSANIIFSTKT